MTRSAYEVVANVESPDEAWELLCAELGLLDWLDHPTRTFVRIGWTPFVSNGAYPEVHSLGVERHHKRPCTVAECVAAVERAEQILAAEAIMREIDSRAVRFAWQIGGRRPLSHESVTRQQRAVGPYDASYMGEPDPMRLWMRMEPSRPLGPFPLEQFKLPPDAPLGKRIVVSDATGRANDFPIVVSPTAGHELISGMTQLVINQKYLAVEFVRVPDGWRLVN